MKILAFCQHYWPEPPLPDVCGELARLSCGGVSRRLYNRADRILITSKMFREHLETEHGVLDEKIA